MASPPGDLGMNRHYLRATVAAASLFGTLFVAVAWLAPAPRLLWNASASAPIGLYRIDPGATPRAGDRKSVGSGKGVSVRVDLGGRRILKKKTKINKPKT